MPTSDDIEWSIEHSSVIDQSNDFEVKQISKTITLQEQRDNTLNRIEKFDEFNKKIDMS